ncbi:hypothetical protein HYW76_02930 [Candidatus Pacearchaeota archaeon]|nr:hypothetical protein [Candidatus Pacearchaeota archaeon]
MGKIIFDRKMHLGYLARKFSKNNSFCDIDTLSRYIDNLSRRYDVGLSEFGRIQGCYERGELDLFCRIRRDLPIDSKLELEDIAEYYCEAKKNGFAGKYSELIDTLKEKGKLKKSKPGNIRVKIPQLA